MPTSVHSGIIIGPSRSRPSGRSSTRPSRVLANSGAWQALAIRPALEELEFEEAALLGKPKAAALALPAGVAAPPGRKPPAWHDAPGPRQGRDAGRPRPAPLAPQTAHGLNARPGTGRPG